MKEDNVLDSGFEPQPEKEVPDVMELIRDCLVQVHKKGIYSRTGFTIVLSPKLHRALENQLIEKYSKIPAYSGIESGISKIVILGNRVISSNECKGIMIVESIVSHEISL